MKNQPVKPSSWLESVNCAIEGILWTARSQRHLRWHFLAALGLLVAAMAFKVSVLEFILLTFAVTLVLFAELMNTAVEVLVDLVSPEVHPLAKLAKDVAAGAVLVASIGAAIMGYFALSGYLFAPVAKKLEGLQHPPGEVAVVSVIAVAILVILLKARFGTGTPLHGGMPSGHSAVAFAIATSVVLAQASLVIIIFAVALATMVSHSRLLMKIHTLKEVLLGAAVGVAVTLAVHAWIN